MSTFKADFSTTDSDGNAVTGSVSGNVAAGSNPTPPNPGPPSNSWPDASTTGCDDSAKTPATSNNLNTDGKTYSGLKFTNTVSISANDVTLKNCEITIPPAAPWAVGVEGGLQGVKILNNTIIGNGSAGGVGVYGIYCKGNSEVLIDSNDISKIGQNAVNDGKVTFTKNFIHDLESGAGTHYEQLYYGGAAKSADFSLTVRDNTFDNQIDQTAAVFLESYFGALQNVTIDHNLLKGGSYTVYVTGAYTDKPIKNVKITNNKMGKGLYGYINAYKGQASVYEVEISGNTDWETGEPVDVSVDPNMAPMATRKRPGDRGR